MTGNKRIYLASPHMSDEGYEREYINEAFNTNWITTLGQNVEGFEKELSQKVGLKAAAALSSGTAGIHLALMAAGVGPGDIVLCQSLTFSASANPIVYLGAKPVFIGSSRETWNMDPEALETALRKYRVKAVVVVHLYGLSADIDQINALCKSYGAALIEDAAESLGTLYKGKHTGTIGDFGVYSFNGNKIITTSGGGMLVSDSEESIAKARFWATQAKDPARYYLHSELGFNYRMSNIVAGIGRGQLRVLDRRLEKKREIYEIYRRELGVLEGVGLMPDNRWDETNRWLSCITLCGKIKPVDVIDALETENIESRFLWKPMHQQPFYKDCDYIGDNVSDWLFEHGLCLPSDTKLTNEEQYRVIEIIRSLWHS